MRILGLIPARAGSKGIPGKNTRTLGGRSLVQRAYDAARESGVIDLVILSTDSAAIAEHARGFGLDVAWLRPAALAADETPMIDVALHALDSPEARALAPDALLLLQPTAPLRTAEHLRRAVEALEPDVESVCSVHELPRAYGPHFLMKRTADGWLEFYLADGGRYTRRQDVPPAFKRDGTVYLTRTRVLREQRSFYGQRCRPLVLDERETLNLDTLADWDEAVRRLGE